MQIGIIPCKADFGGMQFLLFPYSWSVVVGGMYLQSCDIYAPQPGTPNQNLAGFLSILSRVKSSVKGSMDRGKNAGNFLIACNLPP